MNLNDYIIEERKFLHDISNHIVILEGMLASALRKLESSQEGSPELEKLRKSLASAKKVRESTVARKVFIENIVESLTD